MEEKENKTAKTKQKNPRSEGGEEQTELWTKVTPDSEDTLQPAPRGKETRVRVLLLCSRELPPPLDSNSLAFSVFFFFF